MPSSASSNSARRDPVARNAAQEDEVRRTYRRKRSAEDARQRAMSLSRLFEADIIPKLELLHPRLPPATHQSPTRPDAHAVEAFAQLVLGPDLSAASDAFTVLLTKGHTAESLFLDLLAPAAALLGRLWDEDLCDFIEVTTGVAHLQMLLSSFRSETGLNERTRHVLLMGAPGEKHRFGVAVVEQFLRNAGWQVTNGMASSPEAIADLVGERWFGIVGMALGCESRADALGVSIRSVRKASRNPSIGVMVGGPVFLAHPELVQRVGADACAVDAPTAVLVAQRLLDVAIADVQARGAGLLPARRVA
ncbi:B12-binding domain-containing protein [uncultured Methylobacterium sp.]|uniref:cobalamin B12-binding domain-containing protein n=1 Tax=uncultured Methylobacterium sp. TaxID=157278 RepID=UPI0035CB0BD2